MRSIFLVALLATSMSAVKLHLVEDAQVPATLDVDADPAAEADPAPEPPKEPQETPAE